jgi:hypothetical protein
MKLDLAAIRARANAATPAPWRAGSRETWHVFGAIGDPSLMAPVLGRVVCRINQHFPHEADAAFIAAARTDVPALVARVEALERAIRIAIGDSAMQADTHAELCAALEGDE